MTARLSEDLVRDAGDEIRRLGLDGWLLYELKGRNPVAARLLGLPEHGLTRRSFVLLRPGRPPVAVAHRIELSHWEGWPHELRPYVGWEELEGTLADVLAGCDRVAMEVSEGDAVPLVDTVPAGVVEMVRAAGAEVTGSAPLLARTYARWGEAGLELHRRAGEVLAATARRAFGLAAEAAGAVSGVGPGKAGSAGADGTGEGPAAGPGDADRPASTEHALRSWILAELEARGLTEVDAIVAVGPNTALPHYEPGPERAARIRAGEVLLVDLWGKVAGRPEAVFADQTWMGFLGPELPDDVADAWEAVRAGRDGAVDLVRERAAEPPTGADVDRHVRAILEGRGYGAAILHRTGHGLDRAVHGFGPNLDSVETRDERPLVEGIGFTVEPGLYFEGRFGLRSEINVHMGPDGPEVTTPSVQERPWTTDDRG